MSKTRQVNLYNARKRCKAVVEECQAQNEHALCINKKVLDCKVH